MTSRSPSMLEGSTVHQVRSESSHQSGNFDRNDRGHSERNHGEVDAAGPAVGSAGCSRRGRNRHKFKRKHFKDLGRHPRKRFHSGGWRPYFKRSRDRRPSADFSQRKKNKHQKSRRERQQQKINDLRQRLQENHPLAPYNTTQFLMKEHEEDYDTQLVQDVNSWPHRKRSSSFTSMDSDDDDFYYSSPESEEEFVDQDFAQEYQNQILERLESLDKSELINVCIDLEGKVEHLRSQLEDAKRGEVPMSPEMAEKIKVYQKEIDGLTAENRRLRDLEIKVRGKRPRRHSIADGSQGIISSSSSLTESSDTSSPIDSVMFSSVEASTTTVSERQESLPAVFDEEMAPPSVPASSETVGGGCQDKD